MAAGSTYTTIATTTLGSAAASYTFSSIPSTYTDLVLVCSVLMASNSNNLKLQFNGDTGTNYSNTWLSMYGTTSVQSSRQSNVAQISVGLPTGFSATNPGTAIINVQNYSNTTTNKTVIYRMGAAAVGASDGEVTATAGLWRNTAAITSLTLTGSVNIATGTTFTLYGIAAA
jgi:hypothetical protein